MILRAPPSALPLLHPFDQTRRVRRWHPAPAGHELVADMLFMHYGKLFLEAIDPLEQASPGVTAAQLREKKEQQGQQPQQERSRKDDGSDNSDHGMMSMEALREAVGMAEDNPNVRDKNIWSQRNTNAIRQTTIICVI